ncbi:MAG TPA: hypothetical protein VG496_20480 [Myxococcales bacterium]|nr:hypothetical protein [Myxococcales bacterium]
MLRRFSLALLVICSLAGAARAQVFSPGPLFKGHADLEGLSNCTKCHVAGAQLSQDRCLDCHTELKQRVAKKQGYHGQIPAAERACETCHHEHQGLDFAIVDWGKGGKNAFDHRRTGWPLNGKHAKLKCDECHQDRLITDSSVRELHKKRRDTYLGLPAKCAACHFDEHRGQLGTECKDCHNEKAWKPAPGFDHSTTNYPLEGKHAQVKCADCHKQRERDPNFSRNAFPRPVSEMFSRYKPVAHDACTACHKDPHQNRFGQQCESCHSVEGWMVMKGVSGERAFHEKTRYPLRGAHAQVACKNCHGPYPGVAAKFKGLPFDTCASCHVDAHLAQLGKLRDAKGGACERCHTVQGFRPVKYELQDHDSWPLLGAHQAVACVECHRPDPKLEQRAVPIRAWVKKRKRSDQIVLTQFHPAGNNSRCDTCHRDPHGGQFQKRVQKSGCADCHQVDAWQQLRFDHDRETKFALTGGHAGRSCDSCHVAEAGIVQYAATPMACASCHADIHVGQFATARGKPTDCTRCHSATTWQELSFVHKPPFTTYELDGKHVSVPCASCHTEVAVAAGVRTRRYRGLPRTCEQCHVDVHHGAFQGFTP